MDKAIQRHTHKKAITVFQRQKILQEQLQLWIVTEALYHAVSQPVAEAFTQACVPSAIFQSSQDCETFQQQGKAQWGNLWIPAIAKGVYGLLIHKDLAVRSALPRSFTQGLSREEENNNPQRAMMHLQIIQILYPFLFTYWHLMPTSVPSLTLALMSNIGIALTSVLTTENFANGTSSTFRKTVWEKIKGHLQATESPFLWHTFINSVLRQPSEMGGLPLASHDGTPDANYRVYCLPAVCVNQLFTPKGLPINQNHYGLRQERELIFKEHHIHSKFFPKLPGMEEAVQVLSQHLQLGGIALSQLFCCPYQIPQEIRDIKLYKRLLDPSHTLGFPLLLSQHVVGENVQDGLSGYPEVMEDKLSQLHRSHFTRLLLLTLLIHPGNGRPGSFILSETIPDCEGNTYMLTSVDNDHGFVTPWIKTIKDGIQIQIKTLVYCVNAMKQSLDLAVLAHFKAQITRLASQEEHKINAAKVTPIDQTTTIIYQWLEMLDKRYEIYYALFTDKERQALQMPHKPPYGLPVSSDQQQVDPVNPLLQLTPQNVGGVYQRLERLIHVLDTTADLSALTGLSLLQQVSPLIYPYYQVLHQRYTTVNERFQHIGEKQYEETIEINPETGKSRKWSSGYRNRNMLLHHQSTSSNALIESTAFRPGQLSKRLGNFSTIHYATVAQQLLSTHSSIIKRGEKVYYDLLLDRQRIAVLQSINVKACRVKEQLRLLDYWACLVVDTLPLLGFTRLNDSLLLRVLQNKPLLHTLELTDSEVLTDKGLHTICHYTPALNTLVLKRCKQLHHWPNFIPPAGLLSIFTSQRPFILEQLHNLHISNCPLLQLSLLTPQLKVLEINHCQNLVDVGIVGFKTVLTTLNLNALPQLSAQSLRALLYNTDVCTRITLTGLIDVQTPNRARALLHALWTADPEACHHTLGLSLLDRLLTPIVGVEDFDEDDGQTDPMLESTIEGNALDLRGLPLSSAWFKRLIPHLQQSQLHQLQLPLFAPGRLGELLSIAALPEISVTSVMSFTDDRDPGIASPSVLRGHTDVVSTLQTLADGSMMSGSMDTTLRHWVRDIQGRWSCAAVLEGHTLWVYALQALADGSVVSGSRDKTLRHWVRDGQGQWSCVAVLQGHTDTVLALQVLSDGNLMSGSRDKTLHHWVRDSQGQWSCVAVLQGHIDAVRALQVLPDGSVMSGSWDKTLRHWVYDDQGMWFCAAVLIDHTDAVLALQALADGSVVSGSRDGTLRHWRCDDQGLWSCTAVLKGHTNAVYALQILADGSVVSSSSDNTLRYWVRDGQEQWFCATVLQRHADTAWALQILTDGSLMSGMSDNTLRHWSYVSVPLPLVPLCQALEESFEALTVRWAQNQILVLLANNTSFVPSNDNLTTTANSVAQKSKSTPLTAALIAIVETFMSLNSKPLQEERYSDNLNLIPLFTVEESEMFSVVIKSTQKTVLLGFMEGLLTGLIPDSVYIDGPQDVDEAQVMSLLEQTQRIRGIRILYPLSFLRRQQLIHKALILTKLIWQSPLGHSKKAVLQSHTDLVHALQSLVDGSVISGSMDKTLRHWVHNSQGRWSCVATLEGHNYAVRTLQVLADGSVMSGSTDKTLRHWICDGHRQWSCAAVLQGHAGSVYALQALVDGSVMSGSHDKTLHHWVRDSEGQWSCVAVLQGHTGSVYALQALTDGSVMSGSWDGTMRHWVRDNQAEWSCTAVLRGHTSSVSALQVLTNGSVMSGSWDKTLRHWVRDNQGQWSCVAVLEGHTGSIYALQSLVDGSVVSGSHDGTLRHWVHDDQRQWTCATVLRGHTDAVSALQALADGSIMSGSWDKTLRHWSLPTQYSLILPTATKMRILWLKTTVSPEEPDSTYNIALPWPGRLWSCVIISSNTLAMIIHHNHFPRWSKVIKKIGIGIFQGLVGHCHYSLDETADRVHCTFHFTQALSYLEEIQNTFNALHERIERGWFPNPAVKRPASKVKKLLDKRPVNSSSIRIHFHRDSPLTAHKHPSIAGKESEDGKRKLNTLGDGNCAFNAVALGIGYLMNRAFCLKEQYTDANASLILPNALVTWLANTSLFRVDDLIPCVTDSEDKVSMDKRRYDALLNLWAEKRIGDDGDNLQRQLAPLLREAAMRYIEENKVIYASIYEEALKDAFTQYIVDDYYRDDSGLLQHTFIRDKFSTFKAVYLLGLEAIQRGDNPHMTQESLLTGCFERLLDWWRNSDEGKKKYVAKMSKPAKSASQSERWGGGQEISALAQLLDLEISWQGSNMLQPCSLGSVFGKVKINGIINEAMARRLVSLGVLENRHGHYVIVLENKAELESRLIPLSDNELSSLKNLLALSNEGTAFPEKCPDNMNNAAFISLRERLYQRGILSCTNKESYRWISTEDNLIDELRIKQLSQGVSEQIRNILQECHTPLLGSFTVRHEGAHWSCVVTVANEDDEKAIAPLIKKNNNHWLKVVVRS